MVRTALDRGPLALAELAFGLSRCRIDILGFLSRRGRATTAEIMWELGLSRNGVLRHLYALETGGLLDVERTTHPRGSGPIAYWRVAPDAVADALDALGREVGPPAG